MSEAVFARLEAESAIRRLAGLYCDAVNRRDADAAAALFGPDARIRIADGPELAGREAIGEGIRQTFAAFTFLRQHCDASLIDVEGDRARSRLWVYEFARRPGDECLSLLYGAYEDEYALLAEGWRFIRRRFTLQLRTRVELAKAQQAESFDLAFSFTPTL